MRAGFQRDVDRRTVCGVAGLFKRQDLSVVQPLPGVEAFYPRPSLPWTTTAPTMGFGDARRLPRQD